MQEAIEILTQIALRYHAESKSHREDSKLSEAMTALDKATAILEAVAELNNKLLNQKNQ